MNDKYTHTIMESFWDGQYMINVPFSQIKAMCLKIDNQVVSANSEMSFDINSFQGLNMLKKVIPTTDTTELEFEFKNKLTIDEINNVKCITNFISRTDRQLMVSEIKNRNELNYEINGKQIKIIFFEGK